MNESKRQIDQVDQVTGTIVFKTIAENKIVRSNLLNFNIISARDTWDLNLNFGGDEEAYEMQAKIEGKNSLRKFVQDFWKFFIEGIDR